MQAGFASLCSQAAVSLVNNKGDVLAVLKDLASDQGMRALASAMLTASLTTGGLKLAGLDPKDAAKAAEAAKDGANTGQQVAGAAQAGQSLQDAITKVAITGGVQAGVGTALYGGNLGQNLLTSLRSAAVDSLGEKAANEIGAAAARNDLDYVTHKIAHAALGGAMAAADGKDAASGAIGGVVGEIAAQELSRVLTEKLDSGTITPKEVGAWMDRGVDVSKLAAGLVAAAVGADVNTAAHTGGNAAQNNCWKTLLGALYAAVIGKGDLVGGLAAIGRGDDPISKAINGLIVGGVSLAASKYPDETKSMLNLLSKAAGFIEAKVTYYDQATGGYVSAAWSSLTPTQQQAIIGAVTIVTLDADAIKKVAGLKQTATEMKYAEQAASAARRAEAAIVLPKEIVALSEANIRNSGITVLGSYPGYIGKATGNNASYFNIGNAWNTLTREERWAANAHFLDVISANGDRVYLSTNIKNIDQGSYLWREVNYLINSKGYKPTANGMGLVK